MYSCIGVGSIKGGDAPVHSIGFLEIFWQEVFGSIYYEIRLCNFRSYVVTMIIKRKVLIQVHAKKFVGTVRGV